MSDAQPPLVEMHGMSISFGGVRAVEADAHAAHLDQGGPGVAHPALPLRVRER